MDHWLPSLSWTSWVLLGLSAVSIGFSKSGLSGVGVIGILLFAEVFPARESTGMLLLPLIVGDFSSVYLFHQQADIKQLQRVALPAILGVLAGWILLQHLNNSQMRPIIGWITLGITALQIVKNRLGHWIESSFHSPIFAWSMGGLGGVTTMLANAAGPVMSLFFLAMNLPKMVFVGTSAWFFLGINLFKVPFSAGIGLIKWQSLGLALCLAPIIFLSCVVGRWILRRISQKLFESLILIFAVVGALRLIFTK